MKNLKVKCDYNSEPYRGNEKKLRKCITLESDILQTRIKSVSNGER